MKEGHITKTLTTITRTKTIGALMDRIKTKIILGTSIRIGTETTSIRTDITTIRGSRLTQIQAGISK